MATEITKKKLNASELNGVETKYVLARRASLGSTLNVVKEDVQNTVSHIARQM